MLQRPITVNFGMSMPGWYDIASLEDINQREDKEGLHESQRWVGWVVRWGRRSCARVERRWEIEQTATPWLQLSNGTDACVCCMHLSVLCFCACVLMCYTGTLRA
jgi:hypothetical protein